MRKYLSKEQRAFVADFLQKVSLLAAAGLVFGQFIPGQRPIWIAFITGILLIFLLMFGAVILKQE